MENRSIQVNILWQFQVGNLRPWFCEQQRQSNSLLLEVKFPFCLSQRNVVFSSALLWLCFLLNPYVSLLTWQEAVQLFTRLVFCSVSELQQLTEV